MNSNDLSDEQLIVRAARGDTSAFESLYDRHAPAVMGLALKITAERAAAEELVQETFWRVWRNAATYQAQRGLFVGWLFGIARNLCIDWLRRRRVRPQVSATEAEAERIEEVPDPASNVAEATLLTLRHEQVRAALAGLPESQRQVIELSYFGGLTRQEIAQKTGEPLGTVHTRARLALQKLRDALQSEGTGE
jgi:RNA polymerase sigma-70 factor (ECF subfamily)